MPGKILRQLGLLLRPLRVDFFCLQISWMDGNYQSPHSKQCSYGLFLKRGLAWWNGNTAWNIHSTWNPLGTCLHGLKMFYLSLHVFLTRWKHSRSTCIPTLILEAWILDSNIPNTFFHTKHFLCCKTCFNCRLKFYTLWIFENQCCIVWSAVPLGAFMLGLARRHKEWLQCH